MVETISCVTCALLIGVLGTCPSRLISSLRFSHSLSSFVMTSVDLMTGGGTFLDEEAIVYGSDMALDWAVSPAASPTFPWSLADFLERSGVL